MKKLLAFVLILGLGTFCAIGCSKETPKPKIDPTKTEKKVEPGTEKEKPVTPPAGEKAPEKKP
jgi:hypothetical protein